jgi:nucleoside phosphorylase
VEVNVAVIIELLTNALTDDELSDLCMGHFGSVHNSFTSGMSKNAKIRELVGYVVRHRESDRLFAEVKKLNPRVYTEFAERLITPAAPGPMPSDFRLTQVTNGKPVPRIGVITALTHETAAVRSALGDPPQINLPGSGAGRAYWLAEIASPFGGVHHVVIAQADIGNNIAAVRGTQVLSHFPTVDSIIMCGIAGGIPQPTKAAEHVRLGDIVISNIKGIVQYDFVKRTVKKRRTSIAEEIRASPHRPSAFLLEAVRILESNSYLGQHPWEERLRDGLARLKWERPDPLSDVLTDPADSEKMIPHPEDPNRRPCQPRVFLAPIASANILLKDWAKRDALRTQFGVKAVEMEGSGIQEATWTQGIGYLVVRGICDYCDQNKNDHWHNYAAMAAAAYIRALLESIPGSAPVHPR